MKTTEIFPYDSEINETKFIHKHKPKYLRPEFIAEYEVPLKADTKKMIFESLETVQKDEVEAMDIHMASRYLKINVLS